MGSVYEVRDLGVQLGGCDILKNISLDVPVARSSPWSALMAPASRHCSAP